VILAALLLAGLTAADFFPLPEGRRATYEERGIGFIVTTDVVGPKVDYGSDRATQVITFQNSKPLNTAFYRVEQDAVYLLGYDKDNPLPSPMPVFKMGEKKTTWEFRGATGATKESELVEATGEAEIKPAKEFLGQKVQFLEVKITAKVGVGPAAEIVEQKAAYAKGIGLVELTSKTRVGKRSVESTLKLVKLENLGG
jgi:hypothetical protein